MFEFNPDGNIVVLSLPCCPMCDELKRKLDDKCIAYDVADLEDSDVYAAMVMEGVSFQEAPVLYDSGFFYTKKEAEQRFEL
ncbi:MAG: hypothetical protein BWY95_00276 [Bacteroidetes bacterium ADurb.BinA104]|nr:MAG: hypothetical protein BWY95_00276 [Bacteroidetes bacterium ADurb.BinA104]